jgi:protein-S-isoprenylcysteine O-methyltransferase Ste14
MATISRRPESTSFGPTETKSRNIQYDETPAVLDAAGVLVSAGGLGTAVKRFNPGLLVAGLVSVAAYVALAIWAWGDWRGFFDHPARVGLVIVFAIATIAAAFTGSSGISSGKREVKSNRWIFIPFTIIAIALAVAPPYDDRRNLMVIDGDWARYIGLLICAIGCALRLLPVFELGPRFSGLVAIQENHTLKTDGLYTFIRHPSYLGLLLTCLGWALTFRSVVGVVISLLLLVPLIPRMNAEEGMLMSEFGDQYSDYMHRTWRLIPLVY